MGVLNIYSKVMDGLEKVLKLVLVCGFVSMIGIMAYQVVMRYIFSSSRPWCEELTLYICCYCVLLATAVAIRKASHLQVDVLIGLLKPKLYHLANAVIWIIGIAFFCVFLKYSVSLSQYATGKSTTMPITMKHVYFSFPLGSVLMILFALESVCKHFVGFLRGGATQPGGEG